MYGCESWTIKKAECWRIDAFGLWCWRRLLRVPWTARRSNQSILKEVSPGCSLEELMLKLKLQYFLPPDATTWRIGWERLRAGGEEDNRGWDSWMASPTQWTWVWVDSRSWWWTGRPGMLRFMGLQRVGHDWATELNWIDLSYNWKFVLTYLSYNWKFVPFNCLHPSLSPPLPPLVMINLISLAISLFDFEL